MTAYNNNNRYIQQLLLLLKWNSSNPTSFDTDSEKLRQFFSKFDKIETGLIGFNSTIELYCHWPCVVPSLAIPPPTTDHNISLTQIKPISASFYLKPITPDFTNLTTNSFIVSAMDLKKELAFSQPVERELERFQLFLEIFGEREFGKNELGQIDCWLDFFFFDVIVD